MEDQVLHYKYRHSVVESLVGYAKPISAPANREHKITISAWNTGGAWDNAKKHIEAGVSKHAKMLGPKGFDTHKAAVIGDTIGDPLKDTSGPFLNILIKLMAIESLVFAPFFASHGGLLFKIF